MVIKTTGIRGLKIWKDRKKKVIPVVMVKPLRSRRLMSRLKHPFPPSRIVDFVYNMAFELQTGIVQNVMGIPVIFNLNSISRPIVGQTSGNYLPQGFSQFVNIYKSYKVLNSKIRITVTDTKFKNATLLIFASASRDTETVVGKQIAQIDMKMNTWTLSLGSDGKPHKWSKSFNISSLEGVSRQAYINDFYDYEGNMTMAAGAAIFPARQCKLHFAVTNTDDGSDVSAQVELEIIYRTKLFSLVSLGLSQSTA